MEPQSAVTPGPSLWPPGPHTVVMHKPWLMQTNLCLYCDCVSQLFHPCERTDGRFQELCSG